MTAQSSGLLVDFTSTREEVFLDKAIAALVGSAIADAMGWITEFMRSPGALERYTGLHWLNRYVSWPKNTGGRFNTYVDQINEGDYSDDTQLSLCIARSIEPDGSANARYFMKVELPLWMQYARGAGSTITAAAKAASRQRADWNSNFFAYRQGSRGIDYRDAGANGAAMRVLPLAIANVSDPERLSSEVWKTSVVTHGHPRAIVGALLIAEAARRVLVGEYLTRDEFLPGLRAFVDGIVIPNNDDFAGWVLSWERERPVSFLDVLHETKAEAKDALAIAATAREEPIEDVLRRLGCYAPATKGSGIGSTVAAIALFYRYGGDYRSCVEHAVNLIGTDTDTIGAMAGALAGALGGSDAMPEDWAVKVQDYGYLNRVAEALVRIGLRRADAWELGPLTTLEGMTRDATDLTAASSFSRGQRVSHPIFGFGWISHVQSQQIRRKSGGLITLVDVAFDMGQTVRLRTRPQLLKVDRQQIEATRARLAPKDPQAVLL